uniref:Uncharacterized protein n=1 Tax=virus sp. ctML55 TaxID=2827627 RepID=A0A8S5RHS2_9VIRU|nr:MAG TPA: hypothetical protein [virus sp. ctML55]
MDYQLSYYLIKLILSFTWVYCVIFKVSLDIS